MSLTASLSKLGTDVKGDIFEYLLTHLPVSAQRPVSHSPPDPYYDG